MSVQHGVTRALTEEFCYGLLFPARDCCLHFSCVNHMTQSNEEDEGVAESITLVADMNEHKHTLLLFPPLNSNRFSPSVAYIIHMSCTIRTTAVCLGKHSPIYTLQSLHPPLSTCLSQPLTLGEQRQTHVNNCMEVAEGKSGQRTERE